MADEEFVAANCEVGPSGWGIEVDLGKELESLRIGLDVKENAALVEGQDTISLGDHGAVFAEFVIGGPEGFTGLGIEAVEFFIATVEVDFAVEDDTSYV